MKKRKMVSAPVIGGSSLLAVFAVLCLTIFSLLALHTALAEKRLSDAGAVGVAAYYDADLEAERIFARLRAGESVPGVTRQDGVYRYQCPVSENQTLWVALEQEGEQWRVLRWQTQVGTELTDDSLNVWDGQLEEEFYE